MFERRWIAVEGDPSYFMDLRLNAAILAVALLPLLFFLARAILAAWRGGGLRRVGLLDAAVVGAAPLGAAVAVGLYTEMWALAALTAATAAAGAALGWARSRAAWRRAAWAVGAPLLALAVALCPAGSSIMTGEAERVTNLMSVIHCAQLDHHSRHGVYGPVAEIHRDYEPVPRLPGHPEAPPYNWSFTDISTRGGAPLAPEREYAVCATPRRYMVTAQYTLIMDQRGVPNVLDPECGYYFKDTGGAAVTDFPADPGADGWTAYRPFGALPAHDPTMR